MSLREYARRLPRPVRWFGAAALLVALLAAGTHTPPVRRAVLGRVIRALEADGRLIVRASALHYNLLAGAIALDDVTVAARDTADRPFLRAGRVEAMVPWRSLFGPLRLGALSLDRPRIEVIRDAQGRTNLPASAPSSGEPAPLPIARLRVNGAAVVYRDATAGLAVDLPSIAVDLAPGGPGARGTLALTRPGTFRTSTHETTISSVEGHLSWDGRTLGIAPATITCPESTLSLRGTIDVLKAHPSMALDTQGWADLPGVSRWIPVTPPIDGRLAWTGHVGGPLDAPLARLSIETTDAGWQTLRPARLRAALTANANQVVFERFDLTAVGGRASLSGRMDFRGASPLVEARASWSDLDVGQLAAVAATALPARVAARADGRATVRGPIDDPAKFQAEFEVVLREGQGVPGSGVPVLPVRGAVHASIAAGRWRADAHMTVASAVLTADATGTATGTGATIDARARADVTALADTARALARAGVWLPDGFDGRAVLAATVRGVLRDPALDLDLRGDEVRLAGVPRAIVAAHAAGSLDRLRLTDVVASAGSNRLSASGTISPRRGTVDLDVTGTIADPGALAMALPADVRPSGDLRLDARVAGTLDHPRVRATIDGRDLRAAGQQVDGVAADVRLAGTVVTVERLEARQAGGRLDASGTFDLSRDRFTASVVAKGLHLAPLPPRLLADPISGTLDAQFHGSGTVADPTGQGSFTITDARIDSESVGRLDATVTLGGRAARVDLLAPDWQAHAQGRVGLAAPHPVEVTAAVLETDLARLLALVPGAPANVRGTFTVTLHATGDADRPEDMAATVTLERLDARVGDVPVRVRRPARADYANRAVTIDALEATVGQSSLRASGALTTAATGPIPHERADPGVRIQIDARAEDLVALAGALGAAPAGLSASGPLQVEALVRGTLAHLAVTGTAKVTDARVRSGELPEVRVTAIDASFDPSRVTIAAFTAAWQNAAVTGSASLPLALVATYLPAALQPSDVRSGRPSLGYARDTSGLPEQTGGLEPSRSGSGPNAEPARLDLRATNIGPEVVRPFVDAATAARLGGRASISVTLETDALALDRVRGAVQLDELDVTVAELPIRQAAPTRLEVANGFARVVRWSWTGEGAELNVVGQVRLADRVAALIVTGAMDLRLLTPFVAESGVQTAGRLAPHLVISGPIDDVKIDGEVSVSGGELETAQPALSATDIAARATVSRSRLELVSLTGLLNGGAVQGRGWVTLRDFVPAAGRLAFTARGVGLEIRGLQTEVEGDLALTYAEEALAVGGRVRVLHGAYRESIALTTGLLAALQAQKTATVRAAAGPSLVDRTELDVEVASEEDVRVDNNYGRFDLGGDLRLVGTIAQPALTGRITIREGGELLFGGRTYRLDRPGTIDFSDPFRIEPAVNISAVTHVVAADRSPYDITLRITGTPATITSDLSSAPTLAQTDIVSLLLTGRTADQAGGLQAQVAGQQLLGYLSGEFLGVAGRALGLDRLELGRTQAGYSFNPGLIATETDPGSRLTFGKSIGGDIDVTLSQSLRQSGGLTWIVAYTPGRQVELRFVSAEDNSRAYEFRHNIVFGRPPVDPSAPAKAATARHRSVPTVISVQITGAPPEDERLLARRVSLKAGKHFGFRAWQDDRDRLAAYYEDRGFLEARVTARRQEHDGGVDLTYAIERGPKTSVEVQGFRLQDAVSRALVNAWQHGVLDTFRRDSMARVVRTALAREGYLQPTVTVTFDVGAAEAGDSRSGRASALPAQKVAHVSITPGPRITARVVRIEGVAPEQAATDEAWLRTVRLWDAAFDRPRDVEAALTAHLREAGHLAAVVAIAPPVIESTTGVVVVHVDLGPVYHVSSLRIASSRPGMDALLTAPSGLATGGVYTPGQLALAQGALEAVWRRAGFGQVKVGVETAIEPARAEVAVALQIDAGPRQVLEAVNVSGAAGTRPGLVSRTLDLPLHQPVSLESLLKARTRLAETGIFRRVDVTPEPAGPPEADGDQPVRARVTVEQWPHYRLQYGFRGFDHQPDGPGTPRVLTPGFAADLTRRDLFGAGMTTGASLRAQARGWEGRGFWSAPTLFGRPVTSTFYLARGRQEAPAEAGSFITDGLRTTIEQRFGLPRAFRLLYSYSFENTHVFDPNAKPGDPFAFDLRLHIARLNSSLLVDARDNPDDTRRGFFHSSTVEYAARQLGSELRFTKYNLQQYYFRPVRSVVLASAARLGLGFGTEGRPLILTERFFAGGGRTVRGYPEEGLGPRDVFDRAAGGDAMLVLNQEVRVPVYRWVSGVGFLDAGNVFAKVGDVSVRALKAGAGGGLRIQTPVVLLRIDYGVPLGTVASRRGVWVFSIGQAF